MFGWERVEQGRTGKRYYRENSKNRQDMDRQRVRESENGRGTGRGRLSMGNTRQSHRQTESSLENPLKQTDIQVSPSIPTKPVHPHHHRDRQSSSIFINLDAFLLEQPRRGRSPMEQRVREGDSLWNTMGQIEYKERKEVGRRQDRWDTIGTIREKKSSRAHPQGRLYES